MALITRELMRVLSADIDAALTSIGEKRGVTLKTKGGSYAYDGMSASFKVEVGGIGDTGQAFDKDAQAFLDNARYWGLSPEMLGQSFQYAGEPMKIVGANPRASRFPLIVTKRNGKRVRVPVEAARGLKPSLADGGTGSVTLRQGDIHTKRPDAAILQDLRRVENNLSPENLTCDGELSRAKVRVRQGELLSQRRALVAELGREPTDQELYGV